MPHCTHRKVCCQENPSLSYYITKMDSINICTCVSILFYTVLSYRVWQIVTLFLNSIIDSKHIIIDKPYPPLHTFVTKASYKILKICYKIWENWTWLSKSLLPHKYVSYQKHLSHWLRLNQIQNAHWVWNRNTVKNKFLHNKPTMLNVSSLFTHTNTVAFSNLRRKDW